MGGLGVLGGSTVDLGESARRATNTSCQARASSSWTCWWSWPRRHRACGAVTQIELRCATCGEIVNW